MATFDEFMDKLESIISEEYYDGSLGKWFEQSRKLDTNEGNFYTNLYESIDINDLELYVKCVNLLRPVLKFSDRHYLTLLDICKNTEYEFDSIDNILDTILYEYFDYKILSPDDENNLIYLVRVESLNI